MLTLFIAPISAGCYTTPRTGDESQKSNLKDEIDCLKSEADKADGDENIGSC